MKRSICTTASLAAALALGFLTTGCRSLFHGIADWPSGASPDVPEQVIDALSHDQWTPNVAWTPTWENEDFPRDSTFGSRHRWKHPQLGAALDAARNSNRFTHLSGHVGAGTMPAADRIGDAELAELNELCAALSRRNDMSGWNAAILWAQRNPRSAVIVEPTLRRLVLHPPRYVPEHAHNDPTGSAPHRPGSKQGANSKAGAQAPAVPTVISINMQAAAAEAWCRVLAETNPDPETAFTPAGQSLAAGKLPDKINHELFCGIARRVPPTRIPILAERGFKPQLSRTSPELTEHRRAAMDACLLYAVHHATSSSPDQENSRLFSEDDWPVGLWNCERDSDPRLRSRFCEFLAVLRHPEANRILQEKSADQDQDVREAAQVSLGLLGGDEAWGALRDLAKRNEERTRLIAVRGLSFRGPAELRTYVDDKSPRVRAEVARCLARFPSQEAARLLRELQSDPNLEVQLTAVDSVASWPDSLAAPLLLQSLAESSLRTRQMALAELEKRRGGGLPFPLYGNPQERALRARQWAVEWKLPDTLVSAMHELSQPGNARLDAIRLAELRERVTALGNPFEGGSHIAEADRLLSDLTAADVPLIEELLTQVNESQLDLLLHAALPRVSPAYGALARLEDADARNRQSAAAQLARIGESVSLSPAVLGRLHHLMKHEQDRLVWRSVMQAVHQDGSEAAGQLALLAINNSWPDIRVLGCEYVARHRQSDQAMWLLPLLHDSSRLVQLAAIRAAGACGNRIVLDGPPGQGEPSIRGLRPLLAETHGAARFAVIQSMSRLGDPQAMEELTRLSFDANPATRLDVVRTMGDTGQSRFVEPLIRLAWTERDHHVRQGAVSALGQLVPSERHPPGLAAAKSLAEAVSLWNDWWTAQAHATGPVNAHEGTHERHE